MRSPSRHTRRFARAYPALVVLLLAVAAALALATPAAASKCGDAIIADWFNDGRIDRLYPLHCYEEAIDSIPRDIRDYADAEEVISRALQAAVNGRLDPQGGPDPTPGGGGGGGGGGNQNGSGGSGGEAVGEVDTSGLSSLPIPLLVLGGLSLTLLAAGGVGYLSRRRHEGDAGDGPGGPPLG